MKKPSSLSAKGSSKAHRHRATEERRVPSEMPEGKPDTRAQGKREEVVQPKRQKEQRGSPARNDRVGDRARRRLKGGKRDIGAPREEEAVVQPKRQGQTAKRPSTGQPGREMNALLADGTQAIVILLLVSAICLDLSRVAAQNQKVELPTELWPQACQSWLSSRRLSGDGHTLILPLKG